MVFTRIGLTGCMLADEGHANAGFQDGPTLDTMADWLASRATGHCSAPNAV